MKERPQTQVLWNQEQKALTLEGEPVLEYHLSVPELQGGRGCRRIGRYYRRVGQVWRRRWERELYWLACLELVSCRERSRPFRPWRARLEGEATLLSPTRISLRLEATEWGSDGRPLRVVTGDLWRLPEGAPVALREVLPHRRGWKAQLLERLTQTALSRRAAGELFLEEDFQRVLPEAFSTDRFCLREEGTEFYFPQCTISPAAEGCPALLPGNAPDANRAKKVKKR